MSLLQKYVENSFHVAGVLAKIAIGIPGVILAFLDQPEIRWLILGLTIVFIGSSMLHNALPGRTAKKTIQPYLVFQTLLVVTLMVLNPNLSFYAIWFYVLSVEALMSLPRRSGQLWLLVYVLLTIILLVALLPLIEAAITVPLYLGGFFFFATFANATHQANQAREESQRLLLELQDAHEQLQVYAIKAEQLAVSEERNRLSREMHDTIGHRLTVASVQLEGMQKMITIDAEKAKEMAGVTREQVREALVELRQTVATLRKPLGADLPLDISIGRLVENFQEGTNITTHLMLPEKIPEISPSHQLTLYRTTQEGLTNIQKHARASQVWVQVEHHEKSLTLRVSDNGKGFNEPDTISGFGLKGIRERAARLGGEFWIEERRGGGTVVTVNLPL